MNAHRLSKYPLFLIVVSSIITVPGAVPNESYWPAPGRSVELPGMKNVVSLWDFRDTEVKGKGIILTRDAKVHIAAVGGGDRAQWRDMFDNGDESNMYAAGWIINADTREVVWEMTIDNTSGRSSHRAFDGDISLDRGAYEVYYAAQGYYHNSSFSTSSVNIDRRTGHRSSGGNFFGIFGGDSEDLYDDFMEYAKDYGITVSIDDAIAGSIESFDAPRKDGRSVFSMTGVGDGEFLKKQIRLSKNTTVHIYALGEGRRRDEVFDHGWLVNSTTRERVWDMNDRNTKYAGGASKNIRWNGDLDLPAGAYELYYVTDGSHSSDDWNAKPPYDPFMYGVTLSVVKDGDRSSVTVGEIPDMDNNVIVNLTRVGDNDFATTGFSLKKDTQIRIYALGEQDGDGDMADYGWIVNAKTHERVWAMEGRKTSHAGGDAKNRMVDQIITLPKGDYIASYETDGSHSYHDWNADPPFDEKHYGLSIYGWGDGFDSKSVGTFTEGEDENVIAQLIRVRDDRHVRKTFTISKATKVKVYAVGEGVDGDMVDYGWIEDARSGRTVWEMTYGMTSRAGGAKKNRAVTATIVLEPGEYELNYETDGSHAYNEWNDSAPEDRVHWGITVTKDE